MLIIGITGTLGSGKETVSKYLVKNKGFKRYSVGNYLNSVLRNRGIKINRVSLQDMANEIREQKGADHIVKILFNKAKKSKSNVIIESIRNIKEAEFIKSHKGVLIAIDAEVKQRFKRIKKRASAKDNVTYRQFLMHEKNESGSTNPFSQNLPKCISMADYKLTNNGIKENLFIKIDKVLIKIKKS
ncbi:AAA family ATPase [Patescibacteria group bacterium]